VGDLHSENFGCFRALTGHIVYDIDDFDETTTGPYEYDLRRLASTLVLAAHDNGLRLSAGASAAEEMLVEYLSAVTRPGPKRQRAALARPEDNKRVRRLLNLAGEKRRADMIRPLVRETLPGIFEFKESADFRRGDDGLRRAVIQALPAYLANARAPKGARPRDYSFHDVAIRLAGTGSLGRRRYAILLGKRGRGQDTLESLRLIEWKEALDSALDSPLPRRSPDRAMQVFSAMAAMQLYPKRYIGYATMKGISYQAREIGANDRRFRHSEFADPGRFTAVARVFGAITAQAHLLGAAQVGGGPEPLGALGSRFVLRVIAVASAYAEQTLEDFEEVRKRREELARLWRD
jgi:uncharacterized protein (DUF2252 family)